MAQTPRLGQARSVRWSLGAILVLLAAAAVPAVAAQEDANPLVIIPAAQEIQVERGAQVVLEYTVRNPSTDRTFLLIPEVDTDEAGNWAASVEPDELAIGPGDVRTIRLTLVADHRPSPERATVTLRIDAVEGTQRTQLVATATGHAVSPNLILGLWENRLPAPFGGPGGTFLVDVLIWSTAAMILALGIRPAAKLLVGRTKTNLDDRVVRILGVPLFVALVAYGARDLLFGLFFLVVVVNVFRGLPRSDFPLPGGPQVVPPIILLVYVPLVAYGILRWQLFDIDVKIKWTFRRGTVLAVLAAAFFLVKEAIEALVPGEGLAANLGGAAIVAALLWPTWLAAGALAERVMPGVGRTSDHLEARKADVYRATLEEALADGKVRRKERAMLDGLAAQLGLSFSDAARLEGDVRQRLAA